jgi:sortase A
LVGQFLVQMFASNWEVRRRQDPSAGLPDVDWETIWSAADGADTTEQAIGRVILAGYIAARESQPVLNGAQVAPTAAPFVEEREVANSDTLQSATTLVAPPLATEFGPYDVELRQEFDGQAIQALIRRQQWASFFGWVRNIGIVMLLFVAWQLWGTSISQHHDQHQLQTAFEAAVAAHHGAHESASNTSLIPATQVVTPPAEGNVVAQLQIPAIQLDEYVVSGTAEGDLARGPGHYIGTAAPGQAGNVAIAGHRTTNGAPFNRLGSLVVGDPIYLTTTTGERLTYKVTQAPIAVAPTDVAVLDNFGDNRITLTTCNPEFSATQRLIVVGELLQPNAPSVTKTKPHAYRIASAQTASWNWSLLPYVALELGFLLLLALSNRRLAQLFGRSGRWLILSPLWIAGLYVLFQSLASFLPTAL